MFSINGPELVQAIETVLQYWYIVQIIVYVIQDEYLYKSMYITSITVTLLIYPEYNRNYNSIKNTK